jgi:hypothetical protein
MRDMSAVCLGWAGLGWAGLPDTIIGITVLLCCCQLSLTCSNSNSSVTQARPGEVKLQLLNEGIELEEFGGHVQCVETAARAGQGLTELEEALMLQV